MRVVCELQDRHNGNILLDDAGHLIHIDFGFMLSNSPGSVNFEAAPFKLTRELLEVMDSSSEGHPSEMFDYYKVTQPPPPPPPKQCFKPGHAVQINHSCVEHAKHSFPCVGTAS